MDMVCWGLEDRFWYWVIVYVWHCLLGIPDHVTYLLVDIFVRNGLRNPPWALTPWIYLLFLADLSNYC